MKRSYFKKKSVLKRKTPIVKKSLVRSALRRMSRSPSSILKHEIQAILREIAIRRDGGCVLREYPETGPCSGPLQAEHMVSRQNSATYADPRNIICLCQRHHIFWKPQNSRLYWEIIEGIIGPQRWDYIKRAEADKSPHKMDWKLEKLALEQHLKTLLS